MKKVMLALSTFILVIGLSSTPTKSVDAAVKTFKNCTELNKTYKGGVAK